MNPVKVPTWFLSGGLDKDHLGPYVFYSIGLGFVCFMWFI
jgi:hypothetical protein